jgi:hypothetical protein
MAEAPTLAVDMRTVEQLDDNLANLALFTGRSISSVIKQASFRAARSAAKATPQAKKIRPNKRHKKTAQAKDERGRFLKGVSSLGKNGAPWWAIGSVQTWKRGVESTEFFRKESTYQRARNTPRQGLAKNVWRATGAQFGRLPITGNSGTAKRFGKTTVTKSGADISAVFMSNSLRYIQKIAPNSAKVAIHLTDKWVEGYALPKVKRQFVRQFARGNAAIRNF